MGRCFFCSEVDNSRCVGTIDRQPDDSLWLLWMNVECTQEVVVTTRHRMLFVSRGSSRRSGRLFGTVPRTYMGVWNEVSCVFFFFCLSTKEV